MQNSIVSLNLYYQMQIVFSSQFQTHWLWQATLFQESVPIGLHSGGTSQLKPISASQTTIWTYSLKVAVGIRL